ncbi:LapA family protein [Proteiniborus sp. MB09-C3]|uniref:LapA family protein n=1 Tax=Proteiniborus sp. MB09-C3 TaxID=3050072 RepID=UPI0025540822|nr:LapA family protein [Proteiniborus sp. MB09-C3]WIV11821.1 LapA family protein [Proteiniborus sp. MB09-C3]
MQVKVNMEFKFIVSLLFAVLVAIFAIQNAGNVEINFLFAKFTVSQAVVILVSAIVGAIIVLLLGLIKQIKQNMKIKQLTKEVTKFTDENATLQAKIDELTISIEQDKITEEKNKEAESKEGSLS